jgi:hypothetical protein
MIMVVIHAYFGLRVASLLQRKIAAAPTEGLPAPVMMI